MMKIHILKRYLNSLDKRTCQILSQYAILTPHSQAINKLKFILRID